MKPISGLQVSLNQDSITHPGTLPDSGLTPQNIPTGPIEDSLWDDRPADDRAVDDRPADDGTVDDRPADDRAVDDRPADDRAVDDRPADDRTVDDRTVDYRLVDDRLVDDRLVEDRAVDDRPVDDRPVDDRPADDRAVDDRPVDDRAVDDRAVDDRAVDDRAVNDRAVDDRAVDDRPVDDRPVDDRAVDDRPVEDRTVDDRAVDDRTVDDRAVDDRPVDDRGVDDRAVDDRLVEDKPVDDRLVDDRPVDDRPVDNRPVENRPVDDRPVDDRLVEDRPVDDRPVEDRAVDDKGVDDRPVDDKGVDDRAVDDGAVDDRAVDDKGVDDRAVDDKGVDDRAVDDGAVDDRAVDDKGVDDRAVDDRAVDDRAMDDIVTNCACYCHTRVLILLSKDPTTEASWLSEQGVCRRSEMGQQEMELPSVMVGSLTSNIRPMTPEVISISTGEEDSDTSNELWWDACQYLADEENEGAILDKCGHSPDMAWPRFSADNTKGSDFPSGADTVIGQVGGVLDHLRPTVERWSSVDSWSSALSSWSVEEQVPEDFTAAFTPTLTATQGHPQLPMAIQDQMLESSPKTQSPVLSGPNCFSTSPQTSGKLPKPTQLQVRDRDDNQTPKLRGTPSVKGDKEPRDSQATQGDSFACPADTLSSLGSCCGKRASEQYLYSAGESSDNVFIGNYEDGVEIDTLLLSTAEDTDCQYTFLEGDYTFVKKDKTKRCQGVPGKVTVSLSHFPCQETTRVERECGRATKPLTELHLPTPLQRSALVTTDLQGKGTQVSLNTSPPQEGCQEGTWGSPHFMIPLAPLSHGSTLYHRSNSALEGEQACAKSSFNGAKGHTCLCRQPSELWLSFRRNTDEPNLDNHVNNLSGGHRGQLTIGSAWRLNENSLTYSAEKDFSYSDKTTNVKQLKELGNELSNLVKLTSNNLVVSEEDQVACVTLDLQDPLTSSFKPLFKSVTSGNRHCSVDPKKGLKMPHKSAKHTSEMKTRSKKDSSHQLAPQASKKQENQVLGPNQTSSKQQENLGANEDQDESLVAVIETIVITEKVAKAHGKKKKKHSQNAAVKSDAVPLVEVENGTKQKVAKGKNDVIEAKTTAASGQSKNPPTSCQNSETVHPQILPQQPAVKHASEEVTNKGVGEPLSVAPHVPQNTVSSGQRSDDVIKRRRLSELKSGKHAVDSKAQECSVQARREETKAPLESCRKKAYSDVVKQNVHRNTEVPRVVQPIQAGPVSEDPQSLCLWCQFSAVFTDHTVTWTRDGVTLAEVQRSAGDESRVSVTLSKASNKDLGRYECRLRSCDGSVSLEYLLTYEVLSEIIIPPQRNIPAPPAEVEGEEEEIKCSKLLFHEDFLIDQYFAEDQPASIMTEKVHFGEGMHRRAFRTKMHAGMVSVFMPGHPCVLKVHNSISYGTKNNEELIQKNYNLAVEECHVQNTAREYIKAYTVVAQSKEAFGDVPEIIPIYLVHRPSNDIPYATLEEELLGDFVKYSVRDGKEINLLRRDSEAGQKCCAFQHWVYHKTEGNLLVTDMQGVGMRLTDVGIATCKKGYRGFRGNCATSFIDQFKVLHMCNKYCELLGLKSLQPKPKKAVPAPKPKAHPAPKKKTFGPTVKGKS